MIFIVFFFQLKLQAIISLYNSILVFLNNLDNCLVIQILLIIPHDHFFNKIQNCFGDIFTGQ